MRIYLVIGIILLVVLIAVAVYAVNRARDLAITTELTPEDELAEFKLMREEGKISEEEYRRLKKIVSDKTIQRVKDD